MNEEKSMPEIKTGKWLAIPVIAKIAKYALDIVVILGLGALIVTGSQIFNDALEQMEPLIESGALPECVKNLPMGLAMMLTAAMIGLLWLHRRRL